MNNELKQAASTMGKKGGKATKEKHGLQHFSKLQKLGVKARLAKKANNGKNL